MKFDVLTLFPEMFEPLKQSILGRASKNHILEFNFIKYIRLERRINYEEI